MKWNKKIFIPAVLMVLSLTACEKFLERPPQGQLTMSEALKDEQSLMNFVNGIYTLLGDGNFLGGRVQVLSELLGDHLRGDRFTGDFAEIWRRQNSFFGGTRDDMYKKGYNIIDKANVTLDNLALAGAQRNLIEGQALFFRGMTHFEMVRLFAQPWGYTSDNAHAGIPLKTESSAVSTLRSSVKQVYDQVIADLKAADNLLPADPAGGKYYTATKWAAKAYLAKVYFQMNDFANAYNYADQVIKSGKFQMDANVNNRYSLGLSTESIFSIANNSTFYNPGSELRSNYRSDRNVPTLNLTDVFYNHATSRTSDVRKGWYSNTLQTGYNVLTKFNKDFFDQPIITLTELKLIRAESGAEISGSNAAALGVAITDINDILTRAYGGTSQNLPATASATGVINTVRAERELELVGEGNRLHEIKRIGARTGTNVDRRGSTWNCNGLILQFPKAEQDANAAFQMNPEGGCF